MVEKSVDFEAAQLVDSMVFLLVMMMEAAILWVQLQGNSLVEMKEIQKAVKMVQLQVDECKMVLNSPVLMQVGLSVVQLVDKMVEKKVEMMENLCNDN